MLQSSNNFYSLIDENKNFNPSFNFSPSWESLEKDTNYDDLTKLRIAIYKLTMENNESFVKFSLERK